jgi:hypothetical protein
VVVAVVRVVAVAASVAVAAAAVVAADAVTVARANPKFLPSILTKSWTLTDAPKW